LRLARELLTRFGIEVERIGVVPRGMPEHQPGLKAFSEQIALLGPHRLRAGGGLKTKEALSLASLLQGLAALAPEAPAAVVGTASPFGIVRVQASRCTLCGACPERCPTGALVLCEEANSSRLLFDHARCIACEACVQVCPEGAVELERRLEFSRLGRQTLLAEDRIARCQRCGASIAPQSMLRKVQSALGQGKAPGRYCPPCLMLQSLAGVRQ
jgi:ferredoxin